MLLVRVRQLRDQGSDPTVADFGKMYRQEVVRLPESAQNDLHSLLAPIFKSHFSERALNMLTLAAVSDHMSVVKDIDSDE